MTDWKVELSHRFITYIRVVSEQIFLDLNSAAAHGLTATVTHNLAVLEELNRFTKTVDTLVTGAVDPPSVVKPFGITRSGTPLHTLDQGKWRALFLVFDSEKRYLGASVAETTLWERITRSRDTFWDPSP